MDAADLYRKKVRAQLDMVALQGTPAHQEAVKIVREYEVKIKELEGNSLCRS